MNFCSLFVAIYLPVDHRPQFMVGDISSTSGKAEYSSYFALHDSASLSRSGGNLVQEEVKELKMMSIVMVHILIFLTNYYYLIIAQFPEFESYMASSLHMYMQIINYI